MSEAVFELVWVGKAGLDSSGRRWVGSRVSGRLDVNYRRSIIGIGCRVKYEEMKTSRPHRTST